MHLTLRFPNRIRKFSDPFLAIKGRCLLFSLPVHTRDMKNNKKTSKYCFKLLKLYKGLFLPSHMLKLLKWNVF